jgi:hypothetical protein
VGSLLSALIAGFAPEDRVKGATSPEASSSAAKAAETKSGGGVTGGLTEMFDTAMLVLPLLGTKIIISIGNAMYQGWVLCSTRLQSSLNPAWHAVYPVEVLLCLLRLYARRSQPYPTPHQRVCSHADCACACVSQEHADCASRQFQILRIPDGAIHVELHGLKRRLLGTVRQADCRAIPWSSDSGVSCFSGAVHTLCCIAVEWRHFFVGQDGVAAGLTSRGTLLDLRIFWGRFSVGGMVAAFVGKTVAGMQIVAGADVGPAAMGWLAFTFAASLCGHLLAIVITSESTSLVPDDRRGTLMGLEHGGFSAARVVGPSLGIMLMEGGAFWHVDAAIVAIYGGVFAYWLMPRTGVAPAKGAKAKDE